MLLKDLIPGRVEVYLEVQKNLLQSEIEKKKDDNILDSKSKAQKIQRLSEVQQISA